MLFCQRKLSFPPLYHQNQFLYYPKYIHSRTPTLSIQKVQLLKHFLPARETILRLLVEVNLVSWVSVSLAMMDSSLKPIMRSPGSGSSEPGISFRLKFSELFMLTAIFYEMERGKVSLLNIILLQHHPFLLCHLYVTYINISTQQVY